MLIQRIRIHNTDIYVTAKMDIFQPEPFLMDPGIKHLDQMYMKSKYIRIYIIVEKLNFFTIIFLNAL